MLDPGKSVVLDYEMVHFASDALFVAHKSDVIAFREGSNETRIKMPPQIGGWKKLCMPFRKLRRLLRLDKAMIVPTDTGLVMARLGQIWVYDKASGQWRKSAQELNCRNPMYNGILRLPNGTLYIGEYGNPNGLGKRVLMSADDGLTWTVVYQFEPDEIRHIHCLAWDAYESKIWLFTGDTDTECRVLTFDPALQAWEHVGGGSQKWRACHAMFTKDTVEWIMDSPIEEAHHIKFDRKTNSISIGQGFPGPVWFAKRYDDGTAIAATAQEIGPSHKDKDMHVYQSNDLEQWREIARCKHDGWPKQYFRFGTITVCRGDDKVLSCEGVEGLDGKSIVL